MRLQTVLQNLEESGELFSFGGYSVLNKQERFGIVVLTVHRT
jgi:hypothetical protein